MRNPLTKYYCLAKQMQKYITKLNTSWPNEVFPRDVKMIYQSKTNYLNSLYEQNIEEKLYDHLRRGRKNCQDPTPFAI